MPPLAAILARPVLFEHEWLVIGGERTGSRFHVDPASTSAINVLLSGRKRWAFYRPSRSPPPGVRRRGDGSFEAPPAVWWFGAVLPSLPDCERPIELVQRPGEVVYVPRGWWHTVLNLEESVAYTRNIVSTGSAPATVSSLEAAGQPVAAAVLRILAEAAAGLPSPPGAMAAPPLRFMRRRRRVKLCVPLHGFRQVQDQVALSCRLCAIDQLASEIF